MARSEKICFTVLSVIRLEIPPLRQRKEDIPLLIHHFLENLNRQTSQDIRIRDRDLRALIERDWPGNVRELENMIHSAFLMERNRYLNFSEKRESIIIKNTDAEKKSSKSIQTSRRKKISLESEEIEAIENALYSAKGIQRQAARKLGITLRQLRYRIEKYGIVVRKINVF